MSLHKKKIIVVLPAYNAAKTLVKTYKAIPPGSYNEIFMVDDASHDTTVAVAKKLHIQTIIHPKNKGYGANQKTCYTEALKRGADIIVMLHPDYQYDPAILPSMTAPLIHNTADIVLGSRMLPASRMVDSLRAGMPLYKFIANRLLTTFQNKMLHANLSEYHTGYRAYSRKSLESIDFMRFSDDYIFDNQLLIAYIKNQMRFSEVPVKTRYFKDASSISFKRSIIYGSAIVINTVKAALEK
jgi:glycosyltransferase involved in cell wall biosynthesis